MERKLIYTKDNSATLYVPELDEHYHSIHGAVNESLHVFIKMGLSEKLHLPKINILEIGFGTGLNALITLNEIKAKENKIQYTSIEAFPVELQLVKQLNYPEKINPELQQTFFDMHAADWEHPISITDNFILKKVLKKVALFSSNDLINEELADIIYFDAFAPNKQPEMWRSEIFIQMKELMTPGGILVTYCAQGAARRAMIEAGFKVEKLPGPPYKREMLRCTKT